MLLPTVVPAALLTSARLLTSHQHLINQLTGQMLGVVMQQAELANNATFNPRTGQISPHGEPCFVALLSGGVFAEDALNSEGHQDLGGLTDGIGRCASHGEDLRCLERFKAFTKASAVAVATLLPRRRKLFL
jgi:hypothetical protein